jgi:hypothetical protein
MDSRIASSGEPTTFLRDALGILGTVNTPSAKLDWELV